MYFQPLQVVQFNIGYILEVIDIALTQQKVKNPENLSLADADKKAKS